MSIAARQAAAQAAHHNLPGGNHASKRQLHVSESGELTNSISIGTSSRNCISPKSITQLHINEAISFVHGHTASTFQDNSPGNAPSLMVKKKTQRMSRFDPNQKLYEPGRKFTEQVFFKAFIGGTVCLNAIQLGVEMDHPEFVHAYLGLDCMFASVFGIEMILKLRDLRLKYFHDGWNLLDFGLAWMSIVDVFIFGLMLKGLSNADLRSYSVLRMLRIIRLMRAIRLLRMFRELWKIVKGIIDSLRTIFWAGSLLILIFYVCGIFCCAMIGKNRAAGYYHSNDSDEPESEFHPDFDAYQYYGTVPRAMFTLFETCIEPLNIRPVVEKQPYMLVFFAFFIFLTTFGVLNVIIGVIVDHTMAVSPEVRRAEAIEALKVEMIQLNSVRDACTMANEDQDNKVTLKDIENAMTAQGMHRILENMELPLGISPQELYSLLDAEGDGEITTEHMNKQLTRAVVQTDHQALLELKIGLHATQGFVRQSVTDLDRQVATLTANMKELKNEFSDGIGAIESAITQLQGGTPGGPRRPHSFINSSSRSHGDDGTPVTEHSDTAQSLDSQKRVTFSCIPSVKQFTVSDLSISDQRFRPRPPRQGEANDTFENLPKEAFDA